jgi:hypothetical protein
MTELVIGAALGFILGECALLGLKRVARSLQRDGLTIRLRNLPALQRSTIIGRVLRNAAVFAAGAGVFALAAWSVSNYLAARDAQRAANTASSNPVAAAPSFPTEAGAVKYQGAGSAHAPVAPLAAQVADTDPYADPDFKSPRQPHHSGTPRRLTEVLLQRSETKARADLLKETQEHAQRSQYDCEAAAHAAQYLKSGLDVWGFAAWQRKYFPLDGYQGATLAQCKIIENRVDGSDADSSETVVAEGHAPARSIGR